MRNLEFVEGEHYTNYVEEIRNKKRLKRTTRFGEAKNPLLKPI